MIPKIIHYFWFGNNDLPKKVQRCIESWKKQCPDYQIIRWDETNYDVTSCPYMAQAYNRKYWGFVPDYARFDIIYKYGGIYLDTDVELIKSPDPLLDQTAFFGFESDRDVASGLAFGAEPGHPFIKEHRDFYKTIQFINPDGTLNLTPSPQYTTQLLCRCGLKQDNTFQKIAGLTIYPSDFFAPMSFSTGILNKTANTYSIHWYHASWCSRHQKRIKHLQWTLYRVFGSKLGKTICSLINAGILVLKGDFSSLSDKIRRKLKQPKTAT